MVSRTQWNNIVKVVERFEKDLLPKYLYDEFLLAKDLVEVFRQSQLFQKIARYDLFEVLKIRPEENQLSNVVASLINPGRSPYAKHILTALLKKTDLSRDVQFRRKRLCSIVTMTKEKHFSCRREVSDEESRIDIRVMTHNGQEDLILDFEMKVSGGSETLKDGKYQTEREYKALIDRAGEMEIDEKNVVAYYITPDGRGAKSPKFMAITIDDFLGTITETIVRHRIRKPSQAYIDQDGLGAILHFLDSLSILGWVKSKKWRNHT